MKRTLSLGCLALLGVIGVVMLVVWFQLRLPLYLTAKQTEFTLTGVTVVNPGSDRQEGQNLVVKDGRIESLGEGVLAEGVGLSSFEGSYVLPGLVDLHTHLPPKTPFKLTHYAALLYLRHGVTTIRDAGDGDGTAVGAAREALAAGEFPGPRLFACGPFVGGGPPRWANSLRLEGTAEIDEVVARIKADGFDCVKAYEDLSVEQLRALEAAADRHGLPLLGHVPTLLAYEEALVPDVTHLLGVPPPASLERDHVVDRLIDWRQVDEERLDLIVETTLAHRMANTPTLSSQRQLLLYDDYERAIAEPPVSLMPRMFRAVLWHPTDGLPFFRDLPMERVRESLELKKDLVRRLYEAGAPLRIGTDTPQPFVVYGAGVHDEMELFVEAGIPLEAVWEIATRGAGDALGVPGLGVLEAGAPADLLIFRQDPTRDLAALDSLEAVVTDGQLLTREYLDKALALYQEHIDSPVFDWLSVTIARTLVDHTVQRDY